MTGRLTKFLVTPCLALALLTLTPAAAQPPGLKLIVSPSTINFTNNPGHSPHMTANTEVTVQVLAPPRSPWRLTVQGLGPLQSGRGKTIATNNIKWQGSPGSTFVNGNLSDRPQLAAQGHGTKMGVMRFYLKHSWNHAADHYNQNLVFTLNSP